MEFMHSIIGKNSWARWCRPNQFIKSRRVCLHVVGRFDTLVKMFTSTTSANPSSIRPTKARPERGDFFDQRPGWLSLADGASFAGALPLSQTQRTAAGEVVFNTGMTGYVESLTDPSYAGQILVFTYPLIGNYGVVGSEQWESKKVQAAGVVVSEAALGWSHETAERSLMGWLQEQKVPIITGLDTRALTKHIRTKGSMAGVIGSKRMLAKSIPPVKIPRISISEVQILGDQNGKTVILVDCGVKRSIVDQLEKLSVNIRRVPYDYDYTKESYDGVLLSNGPGDPTDYRPTIGTTKKALRGGKPVFGICLGSQIMGLAAGAKTYKLPYGHRGHNQPCVDSLGEKCYVTSQNHGYALRESSLPRSWRANFRNLNDGSVEGIEHRAKPFFSVQFHPEARPGPTDTAWLFQKFRDAL